MIADDVVMEIASWVREAERATAEKLAQGQLGEAFKDDEAVPCELPLAA